MNLRQVRYFCEIVDAGNAALAAARLHVAPTAISMQLAQLEADLGGSLFDRSRRPMELTALGQYFHPRAKALLAEAQRLEAETRSVATGKTGVLAIGYTRSSIFSILPRAMRSFRATHPQVKVELVTLLSEHQQEQLLDGRIQIGISRYLGAVEPVDGLVFKRLMDDPLVVALHTGHALTRKKAVRVSELDDLPLVTYPKDPLSRFAEQTVSLLRSAGGQSVVGHETNDIHTALGMVASDLGYALVGRSVSEGNRSDVSFVPLARVKDTAAVFAVTRSGEASPLITAFLAALSSATRGSRKATGKTVRRT